MIMLEVRWESKVTTIPEEVGGCGNVNDAAIKESRYIAKGG